MTAPILLQPKPQFCDANGKPYAGGLLYTYVKGTNTLKTTWKDPGQAATNTDPITLDAAGRCDMWGDGDYQLELHDAAGNLIWNVPSTTVVSAAMYPVVSAPTTLDAMNYLGVTGAINAEATARANADQTIITYLDAEFLKLTGGTLVDGTGAGLPDGSLILAHNAVQPLEAVTKQSLDAEASTRQATDTSLQAQISALAGSPVEVARGGTAVLTFGIGTNFATYDITFPPFASATHAVVITPADVLFTTVGGFSNVIFNITNLTNGGARINATGLGGTAAATFNTTVYWVATGS